MSAADRDESTCERCGGPSVDWLGPEFEHLVGTRASYTGSKGKRTKNVAGTIKEVRFAGCSITNPRGEFLGIEFLIKPDKGRAVWTWAMPDEIELTKEVQ